MFCSGCGVAIAPGQGVCSQCGRPVAPALPPVPGIGFELENYAGKIKTLSAVWFIYAGLSLLLGIAGLTFAKGFLMGNFSPWSRMPHGGWDGNGGPPMWFAPAILHFVWVMLIMRSALALVAAWGLMERAPWGRIVAIVAAFLSLLRFPFGTALGIWTLVVLLGYRNARLYEQL
jgi:hypothetical protein